MAKSINERAAVHEPHCNEFCRPNAHYLTNGLGFSHRHKTDVVTSCGKCLTNWLAEAERRIASLAVDVDAPGPWTEGVRDALNEVRALRRELQEADRG